MNLSRRQALVGAATWPAGVARALDLPDLIAGRKSSVFPVGLYNPLDSPRFAFRGTGFLVGDGSLLATCWHVVAEGSAESDRTPRPRLAVQVGTDGGGRAIQEAELAIEDRSHDLAVLRLPQPLGPPLPLAEAAPVREGTAVVLIGFPIGGVLGFRHVSHRGIVSALVASDLPTSRARQLQDARVARLREGAFEMLQLDAIAYPGNSGGPLMSQADGRVVGVVNMVLLKGNRESSLTHPTGISYAVPVRYLAELLARR